MRAADLVGGHDMGCLIGQPYHNGLYRQPDCTCRLAERQAAAAALDAQVAALEAALDDARDIISDHLGASYPMILDRIDALLAGVPRGR